MKKFLVLLFTSFLILGACSNKDSSSENSNKSSINKSDKKLHDNKTVSYTHLTLPTKRIV